MVDVPPEVSAAEGTPDDLAPRLRAHGLPPGPVLLAPPARASGATLLSTNEREAPRLGEPGALPAGVRQVTCVAAVDGCRLPARGRFALAGRPGGDSVEYRARLRSGRRALLELRAPAAPERILSTLRQHGVAVVGEARPDAPGATRLLFHVSGLSGSVEARSPLPADMSSWLAGCATRPPEAFEEALDDAFVRRFGLAQQCQSLRLASELSGDVAGLTVDLHGDYAVVAVSDERAERVVERLGQYLMDRGVRGVYLKRRSRMDVRRADAGQLFPPEPIAGLPARDVLVLRQHGVSLDVRLADGASTGVFLDQRENWLRLRRAAHSRSLLNLFAYTGAFTLFAAVGGARSTTSIDLSSRALGRLAANLERNGQSGEQHRVLKDDVVTWLSRARRRSERFDWIVLDPPSFGTRGRKVLETGRSFGALIEGAARLLAPRGRLLCVSHQRGVDPSAFERGVRDACGRLGRSLRSEAWVAGWDCPTLPGISSTKSVVVTLA